MKVLLNNKPQEVADHPTLSQALRSLQVHALNGVAVAVNNTVIQKEDWDSYFLQPNDRVVLVKASQGG